MKKSNVFIVFLFLFNFAVSAAEYKSKMNCRYLLLNTPDLYKRKIYSQYLDNKNLQKLNMKIERIRRNFVAEVKGGIEFLMAEKSNLALSAAIEDLKNARQNASIKLLN